MPVNEPINVLILDDGEEDALLVIRALRLAGYQPCFERVWSEAQMLQALTDQSWDVIISDYSMHSFTGRDALSTLKASGRDIPFILVSSVMAEEEAVAAMREGASDYLLKDRLVRLGPAVEQALNGTRLRTEREMMKRTLRESEERLRLLISGIKDYAVFSMDPSRNITTWTPGAKSIFGYTAEEAIGPPSSTVYLPEDVERGRPEHALATAKAEGRFEEESQRMRKDGTFAWVEALKDVLRDEEGVLQGYARITRDITERKRAQKALEKAQEQLQHFLFCSPTVIFALEFAQGEFKPLWVSENLTWLLGYSTQEFLTSPGWWIEKIHPEDREKLVATERELLTRGRLVKEYRLRHRNGSYRWILDELREGPPTEGGPPLYIGSWSDITEQKQAAHTLEEHQQQFKAFMENLPGFAWIKDRNGRYTYMNPNLEKQIGLGPAAWAGKDDEDFWPTEAAREYQKNDRAAMESNSPIQVVESFRTGNELHHALVSKFPIKDFAGKCKFVGGVGINITEVKRTEEALQTSTERLRILSRQLLEVQEAERRQLARELHDEVGQNLTAAQIHLENAGRVRPTPPDQDCHIQESIRLIEKILQQTRDISLNLRPSILDDFGLTEALDWFVKRQRKMTGLNIALRGPVPSERFDSVLETACFRIAQEAITNIVRHAKARYVNLTIERHKEHLLMSIKDDGVGFEVEEARKGAVLGGSLGILGMEERATLLGGRLEIVSAPNLGTEIRVRFPLNENFEKSNA
jgi:PAS domain S-box-containing protein